MVGTINLSVQYLVVVFMGCFFKGSPFWLQLQKKINKLLFIKRCLEQQYDSFLHFVDFFKKCNKATYFFAVSFVWISFPSLYTSLKSTGLFFLQPIECRLQPIFIRGIVFIRNVDHFFNLFIVAEPDDLSSFPTGETDLFCEVILFIKCNGPFITIYGVAQNFNIGCKKAPH